ncbi:MAG: hypothetical protein A7316_03385 [Candidatus Altiarchaeales archaeon WOR_SM1_86-2]|nr:MAG: hypothetical protein A7316_03385 [Candidatus Altiarchaeales archaeon WOR_SM1_86-2]
MDLKLIPVLIVFGVLVAGCIGEEEVEVNETDGAGVDDGVPANETVNETLNCTIPHDDLYINEDTVLCRGVYDINDSCAEGVVIINSSNVVLDCNGAVLMGNGAIAVGYTEGYVEGHDAFLVFSNITIKNCILDGVAIRVPIHPTLEGDVGRKLDENPDRIIAVECAENVVMANNTIKGAGVNLDGCMHNVSVIHNIIRNGRINLFGASGSIDINHTIIRYNITDNTIISDNTTGISVVFSSDVYVSNNYITGIGTEEECDRCAGILIVNSSFNFLNNNEIVNKRNGIKLWNSTNNTINSNIVCNNTASDFNLTDSYNNSGTNNACDSGNWNDSGKEGCTYFCNGTLNIPKSKPPPTVIKRFTINAKESEFEPGNITVEEGDFVKLKITKDPGNDCTEFSIFSFGVEYEEMGEETNIEFTADKTGTFKYFCFIPCKGSGGCISCRGGNICGSLKGTIIVQ